MSPSPSRKKNSTPAPAPTTQLRVYLRQSIGEDRNTHGVHAQRGICERFALTLDPTGALWANRIEYVDVGYSRDDDDRPEYLRLLRETAEGDTILIWERSRLGVDIDFAYAVRNLVQRRAARIVVASGEPIDATRNGLVMEHMRGNEGGSELERIRSRTREKLRDRVLKGYVASKLPYGLETYVENPADESSWKRGRIVPTNAAVVVRIAEMYVDGAGYERICTALNTDGILPPGGGPRKLKDRVTFGEWSRAHVHDILTCTLYRDGVYIFGERGGKGGKFAPVSYDHPEWMIGEPDLWSRVDAALAARTTDMRARLNACKHALSGVGRCGKCTGPLSSQTDGRTGKKVTDYQCSRHRRGKGCAVHYRVRAERLEEEIRDGLGEWFDAARGAIREAAREVEKRIAAAGAPDVAGIERELAAARGEQSRLVKLAVATDGAVDAVADALKSGQEAVRRLDAALVRAKAPRSDARLIGRQIEAEAVQRLDALREALHGPDARDALKALFPGGMRVHMTETEVRVEADGVLPTGRTPDAVRPVHRTFAISFARAA